jgi:hypothetical protein
MVHLVASAVLVALGFGLGRVKHPSNLKLSAIKAEVLKLEAEVKNYSVASAAIARLKKLL